MKYTSGLYTKQNETLEQSIANMLETHLQWGKVTNDSRVLDVGCGWGSTLVYMREKNLNCEYVGVTPSSEQVDYIRGLGHSNFSLIESVFEESTFGENSKLFDLILFSGSFCHIKDRDMVLRKAKSLLAPSGSILILRLCTRNKIQ